MKKLMGKFNKKLDANEEGDGAQGGVRGPSIDLIQQGAEAEDSNRSDASRFSPSLKNGGIAGTASGQSISGSTVGESTSSTAKMSPLPGEQVGAGYPGGLGPVDATAVANEYTQTWKKPSDFRGYKEIGSGRNSKIYVAACVKTGRQVVVKMCDKQLMSKTNQVQIAREVMIMAKLSGHKNVIRFLSSFADDRFVYIVQEYAAGGDLFALLNKCSGKLSEKTVVLKVLRPLLHSLVHSHDNAIVHRDIKPENIFFTAEGVLKLGDFGLSIDQTLERPSSRLGTLDYMAPEVLHVIKCRKQEDPHCRCLKCTGQAKGRGADEEDAYDEKIDVWACGILGYELLDGKPPFEVESEELTVAMIMWSELKEFPPTFSPEAIDFFKQVLTKVPKQRPSVREVLNHPWLLKYPEPPAAA
mmetsp:Transcript_68043/g.215240  ORF Transcript_68043/g.215240 Transcript_68043/m.215240 type:complete len:413 (+) Transcript_68043:358-1596(+)